MNVQNGNLKSGKAERNLEVARTAIEEYYERELDEFDLEFLVFYLLKLNRFQMLHLLHNSITCKGFNFNDNVKAFLLSYTTEVFNKLTNNSDETSLQVLNVFFVIAILDHKNAIAQLFKFYFSNNRVNSMYIIQKTHMNEYPQLVIQNIKANFQCSQDFSNSLLDLLNLNMLSFTTFMSSLIIPNIGTSSSETQHKLLILLSVFDDYKKFLINEENLVDIFTMFDELFRVINQRELIEMKFIELVDRINSILEKSVGQLISIIKKGPNDAIHHYSLHTDTYPWLNNLMLFNFHLSIYQTYNRTYSPSIPIEIAKFIDRKMEDSDELLDAIQLVIKGSTISNSFCRFIGSKIESLIEFYGSTFAQLIPIAVYFMSSCSSNKEISSILSIKYLNNDKIVSYMEVDLKFRNMVNALGNSRIIFALKVLIDGLAFVSMSEVSEVERNSHVFRSVVSFVCNLKVDNCWWYLEVLVQLNELTSQHTELLVSNMEEILEPYFLKLCKNFCANYKAPTKMEEGFETGVKNECVRLPNYVRDKVIQIFNN